jgi:aminoglycoside 6'-N-acetyltransferase
MLPDHEASEPKNGLDMTNIQFRPLEKRHLPLLHKWLNTDHVVKWWYGKTPMTPDVVNSKYTPYITGEKPTRAYIIAIDGIDVGYIQTYLICDYPEYNACVHADSHASGVDLYIGHPDFIHRGYGASIMKAFLKDCVFCDPRVDKCIIGPEPKNRAAIRMYEKAGFRWYQTIQVPGEDEPEHMMMLTKKDFEADRSESLCVCTPR